MPGGNLLGKPKLLELLVMRRYFKRKHKDPDSYYYMKAGGHKKLYAESVLTLNKAAAAKASDGGPFLLPLCLPVSRSVWMSDCSVRSWATRNWSFSLCACKTRDGPKMRSLRSEYSP